MTWLPYLVARIRALFRRDVIASEIREELEFHVQMRAEEYARRGATEQDAQRHARQRFGNVALIQDRGYDVRGGGVIETVLQDVRYGVRLLVAQRVFSLVALLTLALGIGLSTALVSVIDAAILRPLPYPHPEQLVSVWAREQEKGGRTYLLSLSPRDVRAVAGDGRIFSDIAIWRRTHERVITVGPEPEALNALEVSDGYFGLYGVKPVIGRGFTSADMREGTPAVGVLDHRYWKARYAGSRDVLGQTLESDSGPIRIVGVLPSSFDVGVQLFRPVIDTRFFEVRGSGASVHARLRTGLSLEQAERELSEFLSHQPGAASDEKAALRSLHGDLVATHKVTATVLTWAVLTILLIACVNVAGLLIARGATRVPELAVRASIGAGRGRLVRQLLTESVILSVAGGVLGILLAWWSLDTLVANIPMSLDVTPTLSLRVLAISAGVSLVTGLLFGIVPALRLSRVNMSRALTRASRTTGSVFSRRSGQLLIGAEIALAVILLAGAGLMLRSFARIQAVDLGFEPDTFLTLEVQTVKPAPSIINTYYPSLLDSIRAMPGVAAAGAIDYLPLGDEHTVSAAWIDDKPEVDVGISEVLPGFFEAAGFTLTRGRFPTDSDRARGHRRIVVNEQAWKELFKSADFVPESRVTLPDGPAEIVGIVKDVRTSGPLYPSKPEIYEVLSQNIKEPPRSLTVLVRAKNGIRLTPDSLRQAAKQIGPPVLVDRIRNGREWFGDLIDTPRRRTVLLSLLGALGLVLALVGVFGMTAYAVTRRTQEIGVRMAFGARPGDVVRAIVRDAAIPVVLGLAAGTAGAMWAGRLISTFLFQTTATDPAAFAAAAASLGVAACLAAWIPARRAARVDPVIALRAE